jgi:hypothetical protein
VLADGIVENAHRAEAYRPGTTGFGPRGNHGYP